MEGARIRERFLSFFEERDHERVPSSSLIPPPESGLLLTNAGMNQFIPFFLGQSEPDHPRAVTAQKVMRTNDIEVVGRDARHETFFEMLGNFSFGDYFKADAIRWAHELVTEGYGIDHDLLWVTVFEEDEEAVRAWTEIAGVSPERIVRRGLVDRYGEPANYWWTHAAGPAGPCSEIFVDRGPRYGPEGGPDVDEERFMEIWNLVFIQDRVDGERTFIEPLPARNVDTGSSIERVAMLLQGVDNVFETDLLRPMLEVAESLSGRTHGHDERDDVSLKIIAEHGRAATFLIADGVQPSNEGRGYVLRRLLRRAVSHGRRLGVEGSLVDPIITQVVAVFGDAYPELRENEAFVRQVAASEEERFSATLRQGLVQFQQARERAVGGRITGDDAFKLSDTFGFPLQLTEELAADAGVGVDTDRFGELLEEQRRRAPGSATKVAGGRGAGAGPPTEFIGYERLDTDGNVSRLLDDENREVAAAEEGAEVRIFLDRTPFYAEAGGQVGDAGTIRTDSGVIRVRDVQWAGPRSIVHLGVVDTGEIRPGQQAHATVDPVRREATARAHTSTHIVHWALKRLLGEHARQAGSLVAPGRLRFDFPHPAAVPQELLEEGELEANALLARDDAVVAYETSLEDAKAKGAVMLFGEKYGDVVRVVEIGGYSRELCGGTHVPRTGRIAMIRILHEGSIGAGMRRVEALVGPDALRAINAERELLQALVNAIGSTDPRGAIDHVRKLIEENKRLRSELGTLQKGDRDAVIEGLVTSAEDVDGIRLVVSEVPGEDASGLRELAQRVRDRLQGAPAAVVLGGGSDGKAQLVAAVTTQAVERGVTGPELLRGAAMTIGGGAGGKDILAMAGGKDAAAIPDALGGIPERTRELLAAR